MKSSHGSDEIFGVPPQMKLNPSSYPDEVGFHRVAISSTAGGFLPQKADLVEKREQVKDLLSFFWRCHPDLNRGIEVLQTFALPLGYGTIFRTEILYHATPGLSMGFGKFF